MDKRVNIRILPPSLSVDKSIVEEFFANAKTSARIAHPNTQNVVDFGTDRDGNVYAVYEPISGETLKNVIRNDGQFPLHAAVSIVKQIASALEVSHEAGVVHGNLSAENVMLARNPNESEIRVKVLDFGSSNPIIGNRGPEGGEGFAYIAPEQCAGSDTATAKGDIYSLGIIAYEMLAGSVPFAAEKATDVMMKHIEEPPPPIVAFRRDLPDGIETSILKSLSKDPEMRYASAAEFSDELELIAATGTESAAAAASGNFWKTAFIALAGIAVLATALIYATSSKQTNPATALQPDANGQPVQPINPATGTEEQALAAMPGVLSDYAGNANMSQPPGTLPGGDNYNPWGAGGAPPAGAPLPNYVPPGGQVYTIDPNNPSQFMPPDGQVVLVPVPANTNTAPKPSPTPRTDTASNASVSGMPAANTAVKPATTQPRATPVPRTTAPAKTQEKSAANTKPE
ncbi:MAG: protein kinase domain-containing protein, partial [Blastocatellia bacterium]